MVIRKAFLTFIFMALACVVLMSAPRAATTAPGGQPAVTAAGPAQGTMARLVQGIAPGG